MRPAELYKFVNDQTEWHFTSADKDVDYDGDTYLAVPMGREGVEVSEEIHQANLSITMPVSNAIAAMHLADQTDFQTTVTVFVDNGNDVLVFWKGRIASVSANDDEATVECESIFTSLRRPGLRARYQRSCRHALYGSGCNLDPEDFGVAGIVDSIDDVLVQVSEAALSDDGHYLGGYLKAPDGTLRYIVDHVGDLLTLSRPIQSLIDAVAAEGSGDTTDVTIYPGCDHTMQTCLDKFANLNNYGGFPWIPGETNNPFTGKSIV